MYIENICYSGGAVGADTLFTECAEKVNHNFINYIFEKHHSKCKNLHTLKHEELILADDDLIKANKTIKRRFPTSNPFVNSLLRRNWWQIKETERVYAVAKIGYDGIVKGGTSWAVQLAIDKCLPEIYIYDFDNTGERIGQNCWKTWDAFEGWKQIDFDKIPKPFGKYTGIGSRELTDDAIEQIKLLYGIK